MIPLSLRKYFCHHLQFPLTIFTSLLLLLFFQTFAVSWDQDKQQFLRIPRNWFQFCKLMRRFHWNWKRNQFRRTNTPTVQLYNVISFSPSHKQGKSTSFRHHLKRSNQIHNSELACKEVRLGIHGVSAYSAYFINLWISLLIYYQNLRYSHYNNTHTVHTHACKHTTITIHFHI